MQRNMKKTGSANTGMASEDIKTERLLMLRQCKWSGSVRLCTYTVSQKNCAKLFCQNFVKCPSTLMIFGTRIAQRIGLCGVHSFSTSP